MATQHDQRNIDPSMRGFAQPAQSSSIPSDSRGANPNGGKQSRYPNAEGYYQQGQPDSIPPGTYSVDDGPGHGGGSDMGVEQGAERREEVNSSSNDQRQQGFYDQGQGNQPSSQPQPQTPTLPPRENDQPAYAYTAGPDRAYGQTGATDTRTDQQAISQDTANGREAPNFVGGPGPAITGGADFRSQGRQYPAAVPGVQHGIQTGPLGVQTAPTRGTGFASAQPGTGTPGNFTHGTQPGGRDPHVGEDRSGAQVHQPSGGTGSVIGGKLQQAAGVLLGSENLKAKGLERESRALGDANVDEAQRLEQEAMAKRQKAVAHDNRGHGGRDLA